MLRPVVIDVGDGVGRVTGRLLRPDGATALYVVAHGAGAGMHHPFLEGMAAALAERAIATLRYQFPYMEGRRKTPDPPERLRRTVRAAVAKARDLTPDLLLVAGGKSLGGRMTSSAQAEAVLPGVSGLVFLGFPLHAPKRPSNHRAAHLAAVEIPMLFIQGTRDDLADIGLLGPIVERLGATMHVVEDGDHSFKVPKRSGRTGDGVLADVADVISHWVQGLG